MLGPRSSRLIQTLEGSNGLTERSEEHTSELQSRSDLVCRLLLEKKKKKQQTNRNISNKNKNAQENESSALRPHRINTAPNIKYDSRQHTEYHEFAYHTRHQMIHT